jgi:predicted nucleic acid-binding protein
MPDRIIIADTSVLIALSNIKMLALLRDLYGYVLVTPQVSIEFGEELPNWIRIEHVADTKKIELLQLELDLGEASAIALAIENPDSTLIIDEYKGRAIAKRMGLKITGILGVIVKAKALKVIEEVKPIIEKLEEVNFRIAPKLRTQILELVGEE